MGGKSLPDANLSGRIRTNRQSFESLPSEEYLKSVEKAVKIFRDMAQHPDSLGFDEETGGFLVLHRRHAPSGFEQEIPVCVLLKKLGFGVLLVEEFPHRKSSDAEIDGIVFEIKQVGPCEKHLAGHTAAVSHGLPQMRQHPAPHRPTNHRCNLARCAHSRHQNLSLHQVGLGRFRWHTLPT